MKHILKRTLSLIIIIIIMGCFMAGCKNDSASQTDNNLDKEHKELTISSFNNLITEDFISAFQEKYPEVNLKIVSYAGINGSGYAMNSLKNGDIPDIYISSQNFDKDSQQKYLLDLSNYEFVNNYSDILLDSLNIDGGIYLLPSGYTLTGIYYNKTILEENNWSVPKSFDEFTALSEKIEAAGYKTMRNAMSLDGFPFNYFFNLGNTVYFGTPEGTEWKESFPSGEAKAAGNSEFRKVAEYFNQWVEKGFITSEHTETEDFYEGKCVFFLCLGLSKYENTASNGKTYQYGMIPWLSKDGDNNMLTRNISGYMGINKTLADEGNEQKLADAIKLLNYVSTPEGQEAFVSSNNQYMSPLNEGIFPEDSPYLEVADLITDGRTVPLLYVGWEKLIIPIAQDIKQLINKEIGVDELIESFDNTNYELLYGSSDDFYAKADKTLTMEETAKLVAIAEGKAADADCAMISLNEYHKNNKKNNQGLGWYIYKGDISTDIVNLIRPRADTISVLEMTGVEIQEMQKAGFDLDKDGNPYEYLLFTKGDIELEKDVIYKLAISTGELTEEMRLHAVETENSPADAIKNYLRKLGTVSDNIIWD